MTPGPLPQTDSPTLFARRCLSCGIRVHPEADSPREICSACGCDFRERPPMSYAEMEGFVPRSTAGTPSPFPDARPRRLPALPARWLPHLVGFTVIAVAGACLIAALAVT